MTPEGRVKKRVKEILNELGAYYTMPIGTGFSSSGAPDFIICIAGLFYGIECKANGGKPTALQLKHHDDIRKAGGIAVVILSYVEVKADFKVVAVGEVGQGNSKDRKGKAAVRVYRAVEE
jgi:pantoate kinase